MSARTGGGVPDFSPPARSAGMTKRRPDGVPPAAVPVPAAAAVVRPADPSTYRRPARRNPAQASQERAQPAAAVPDPRILTAQFRSLRLNVLFVSAAPSAPSTATPATVVRQFVVSLPYEPAIASCDLLVEQLVVRQQTQATVALHTLFPVDSSSGSGSGGLSPLSLAQQLQLFPAFLSTSPQKAAVPAAWQAFCEILVLLDFYDKKSATPFRYLCEAMQMRLVALCAVDHMFPSSLSETKEQLVQEAKTRLKQRSLCLLDEFVAASDPASLVFAKKIEDAVAVAQSHHEATNIDKLLRLQRRWQASVRNRLLVQPHSLSSNNNFRRQSVAAQWQDLCRIYLKEKITETNLPGLILIATALQSQQLLTLLRWHVVDRLLRMRQAGSADGPGPAGLVAAAGAASRCPGAEPDTRRSNDAVLDSLFPLRSEGLPAGSAKNVRSAPLDSLMPFIESVEAAMDPVTLMATPEYPLVRPALQAEWEQHAAAAAISQPSGMTPLPPASSSSSGVTAADVATPTAAASSAETENDMQSAMATEPGSSSVNGPIAPAAPSAATPSSSSSSKGQHPVPGTGPRMQTEPAGAQQQRLAALLVRRRRLERRSSSVAPAPAPAGALQLPSPSPLPAALTFDSAVPSAAASTAAVIPGTDSDDASVLEESQQPRQGRQRSQFTTAAAEDAGNTVKIPDVEALERNISNLLQHTLSVLYSGSPSGGRSPSAHSGAVDGGVSPTMPSNANERAVGFHVTSNSNNSGEGTGGAAGRLLEIMLEESEALALLHVDWRIVSLDKFLSSANIRKIFRRVAHRVIDTSVFEALDAFPDRLLCENAASRLLQLPNPAQWREDILFECSILLGPPSASAACAPGVLLPPQVAEVTALLLDAVMAVRTEAHFCALLGLLAETLRECGIVSPLLQYLELLLRSLQHLFAHQGLVDARNVVQVAALVSPMFDAHPFVQLASSAVSHWDYRADLIAWLCEAGTAGAVMHFARDADFLESDAYFAGELSQQVDFIQGCFRRLDRGDGKGQSSETGPEVGKAVPAVLRQAKVLSLLSSPMAAAVDSSAKTRTAVSAAVTPRRRQPQANLLQPQSQQLHSPVPATGATLLSLVISGRMVRRPENGGQKWRETLLELQQRIAPSSAALASVAMSADEEKETGALLLTAVDGSPSKSSYESSSSQESRSPPSNSAIDNHTSHSRPQSCSRDPAEPAAFPRLIQIARPRFLDGPVGGSWQSILETQRILDQAQSRAEGGVSSAADFVPVYHDNRDGQGDL